MDDYKLNTKYKDRLFRLIFHRGCGVYGDAKRLVVYYRRRNEPL